MSSTARPPRWTIAHLAAIHCWFAVLFGFLATSARPNEEPLRVCASVSSLASLCSEIGGKSVAVSTLVAGTQNAHFLHLDTATIRSMHRTDLYLQQGLGLESAWSAALIERARNPAVATGGSGFLDLSECLPATLRLADAADASRLGGLHALGNPHYLTDPLCGLAVARAIEQKLAELRPEYANAFRARREDFERRWCIALVGKELARVLEPASIDALANAPNAELRNALLAQHKVQGKVRGWLGALAPFAGTRVWVDHDQWQYFARRFALEVVAVLEPEPGVAPTAAHLRRLLARATDQDVALVLCSPGFDPDAAQFVADHSTAERVLLAHESGSAHRSHVFAHRSRHRAGQ